MVTPSNLERTPPFVENIGKFPGNQGEVVVGPSYDSHDQKVSTTATAWDDMWDSLYFLTLWEMLQALAGTEVRYRFIVRLRNDTAGETTSVRLRNATDGETWPESEMSVTSTSWVYKDTGWVSYTPSTTDSIVRNILQAEVSGGTGYINMPVVFMGYLL